MTIDEALEEYLMHLSLNQGKSENTVYSYHKDLNLYVSWLKQQDIETMEEITADHVQDFLVQQRKTKRNQNDFQKECLICL